MKSRLRQPHIVRELRDGKVSPQGSPQQVGPNHASGSAPKVTPMAPGGISYARARAAAAGGGGFVQQVSDGGRLATPFKIATMTVALATAGTLALMAQPEHALIGTDNCFSSVHRWFVVKRDAFFGVETPEEVLKNPSTEVRNLGPPGTNPQRSYAALDEAYEIARLRYLLQRDQDSK